MIHNLLLWGHLCHFRLEEEYLELVLLICCFAVFCCLYKKIFQTLFWEAFEYVVD